ncbi:MAG TPA: AMP-binding protein [Dermatophilaceae bacterium]|nr:AMP-binding protein [Dermatophilaceae bacterium]
MTEPVPRRFNLARYCLGPAPHRPPDRVALLVVHHPEEPLRGVERWTFGELDDAVRACAAGLLGLGLQRGDRVVLRLGNTSEFAVLFFACAAAGLVAVPTSPQLTPEEVAFVVDDVRASALALAPELAAGVDPPHGVRPVTPGDVRAWREAGPRAGWADTGGEDPAYLVFTSGTSGVPKGVLHGHRAVWGRRPMYAGWHDIREGDTVLHAGSLNWTYTLGVGLTDPWAVGATAVVSVGPPDPRAWGRLVAATEATVFAAVPGVFRQVLSRGDLREGDLRTLRHVVTAGEALSPALRTAWGERTGLEMYEALGMSEVSTFVSSSPTVPVHPGSPGRPQAGRRVAVLTVDGERPVPVGARGLLAVHRSDPGLMLRYWERPEEDAAVTRGEWFVSADLVDLDDDGYVHHHGRADDVMTSLGYRVSPLEVEHCLAQHPGVADVAVTEVPVREELTVVTAFVVPRDCGLLGGGTGEGGRASGAFEADLVAHARARLAAYKCPRQVRIVATLPRTANGKLIRRELRRVPDVDG